VSESGGKEHDVRTGDPEVSKRSPAPPPRPGGGRGSWIRLLIFAAATAAVFYVLSRRIDFHKMVRILEGAHWPLLILAASFTLYMPILSALRWRRMLQSLGLDIPFKDCFHMIMAAWPMGTITPSKSGDLMKAYYLKDRAPAVPVLGSVLAERMMDVLVLLFLALVGCMVFRRWGLASIAGGALVVTLGLIFLILRLGLPVPRRFRDKVEPALRSLRLLAATPSLLAWVIFYTVLNWFASIFQMIFCYLALGTRVPLLFAAGALPLAIFVGLLPLTLSGMGTRDSAIVVLFAPYAAADVSLGVGILYSLFGYWLPSLAGLPFLHLVLPRGRRKEEPGEAAV